MSAFGIWEGLARGPVRMVFVAATCYGDFVHGYTIEADYTGITTKTTVGTSVVVI